MTEPKYREYKGEKVRVIFSGTVPGKVYVDLDAMKDLANGKLTTHDLYVEVDHYVEDEDGNLVMIDLYGEMAPRTITVNEWITRLQMGVIEGGIE